MKMTYNSTEKRQRERERWKGGVTLSVPDSIGNSSASESGSHFEEKSTCRKGENKAVLCKVHVQVHINIKIYCTPLHIHTGR